VFKSKNVDWKFHTEIQVQVSKFGLVLIILLAVIDDDVC
jgi:hypothetical protein